MYCNKEHVNILTALLVEHGIHHAVVCPGSRNAVIVHNLNECPSIRCYPVTDERSAGFFALGIAQAICEPVVVCVTSGTALLDVAPAVAEATCQHNGIVVISADRPAAWIGQLDGQTMQQPGALTSFVSKCVTLPKPVDEVSRWHCNRLVNEALIEAWKRERASVHINVPLDEPLFEFTTRQLPIERKISYIEPGDGDLGRLLEDFAHARKPMIVLGQMNEGASVSSECVALAKQVVVVSEALNPMMCSVPFDEVISAIGNDADFLPDFILCLGGEVVSKRLKRFLRLAQPAMVWRVGAGVSDTFMNLTGVVNARVPALLPALLAQLQQGDVSDRRFAGRWHRAFAKAGEARVSYEPEFSQMWAVKAFESAQKKLRCRASFHSANSQPIRLANIYATHYVRCNRGINGIDGSVSTAAGYSVAADEAELAFLVTGDLSFFYDQNGLWNQNLRGNLRIMLLNNGCGEIFLHLPGLENCPARDTMIAARHNASAKGICQECGVRYLSAHDQASLRQALDALLVEKSAQPVLLEVFTNPDADKQALREYDDHIHSILEPVLAR